MYRFFSSSNVRSSGIGLLLGILVAAMPLKAAFAQPSTNVVLTTVLNLTAYIQQPNASGLPIVKVQRFATKDVVAAIGSDLAQPADSLAKAKLLLQFAGIGNTNQATTNAILRTSFGDNTVNTMFSLDFPSRLLLLNNYDIHTDRPGSVSGISNRLDYAMMSISLNTSNLRFEGQGRGKLTSASVTSGKTVLDPRLYPSGYSCSLIGSGKVGSNDAMFTGTFTASSRKVEVQ